MRSKREDRLGDFESAICDLHNMSNLAASYVGDAVDQSVRCNVALPASQAEIAAFCVYHLNAMVMKLKQDFYEALEGRA